MKTVFYSIIVLTELLLIIYFITTGCNWFLIGFIAFALITLYNWIAESRITNELKEIRIKTNRLSFNFFPKVFSNEINYHYVCRSFERIEHETGVQKIIGFSKGLHHINSVRIGFRRFGNTLHSVLYIYDKRKRIKIDLSIAFLEDDLMHVQWNIIDQVLVTKLTNETTGTVQVHKHPVSFNTGFGFQLYPYGCKSVWEVKL